MEYLIECRPLDESFNRLNENGLAVDIYPDAQKSCDIFSNLKSSNYLPYVMAAKYARENKLDDCFVMNTSGNICDATIANIFLVKNQTINTPLLSEGCINGIMRKYLLQKMRAGRYLVEEKQVSIEELKDADEVFLTNAIWGIRWVRYFRGKEFDSSFCRSIFQSMILPLYG